MRDAFFATRAEAGQRLAAELKRFADQDAVVLALPRGGLPVAYEIAQTLQAPLDIILVRKIGAPGNPELAIGAVVAGPEAELVLNAPLIALMQVSPGYIEQETKKQIEEIERRRLIYTTGKPPPEVKGRTVIVVDDGAATGSTIGAVLQALALREPAKLVAALPVAPWDCVETLKEMADEVVCLYTPEPFFSVGTYYREFAQLTDADVIALLGKARV